MTTMEEGSLPTTSDGNKQRQVASDDDNFDSSEQDNVGEQRYDQPPQYSLQSGSTAVAGIMLHPEVHEFIMGLVTCAYHRDAEGLGRLYENDFNHLSDHLFSNSRWPSPEIVEDFCRQHNMFHSLLSCLYQELFYRHLFARCYNLVEPNDRILSWANYVELLLYFAEQECGITPDHPSEGLQLPSEWLWDMLDEYVYQFQDSKLWRSKPSSHFSDEELRKRFNLSWRTARMFKSLTDLVKLSGIEQYLTENQVMHRRDSNLPLRYQLGYFAMICLLRVNVLCGDYRAALNAVSAIRVHPNAFFMRVTACSVTFFYNVGFAYMMLRRYEDAITQGFSPILTYLKARSSLSSQSYQREAMSKIGDRMSMLVMLCESLTASRLDDAMMQQLRVVCPEKIKADNEDTFRDLFYNACPKFINPADVFCPGESYVEYSPHDEPKTRQLVIFLQGVRYQRKVASVRSFAKLYNNMKLKKLASLMDAPSTKDKGSLESVRADIMCVKNLSRRRVWNGGALIDGEIKQSSTGVDFYVENDLIYVQSVTQLKDFTDYFLSQIETTQDLIQSLNAIGAEAATTTASGGDGASSNAAHETGGSGGTGSTVIAPSGGAANFTTPLLSSAAVVDLGSATHSAVEQTTATE